MQFMKRIALVLAIGLTAAAPALAGSINGGITFGDGFATTATDTSIVSQLTVMDVNGTANASACSDAFTVSCPSTGNYALAFDITGGGQLVFDYAGFHFTATSFGTPTRTGLTCTNTGDCSDAISFVATGTVTGGAGFDATPFQMLWSANAMCSQNVINLPMLECGAGTITASWSATLLAGDALAAAIPEPGTLALLGLGLFGLGFAVRRNRT